MIYYLLLVRAINILFIEYVESGAQVYSLCDVINRTPLVVSMVTRSCAALIADKDLSAIVHQIWPARYFCWSAALDAWRGALISPGVCPQLKVVDRSSLNQAFEFPR
jgi:hypothetical protein